MMKNTEKNDTSHHDLKVTQLAKQLTHTSIKNLNFARLIKSDELL